MNKIAQDLPLITTKIDDEKLIGGLWNKYFAEKHSSVISNLRALFQQDPALQAKLTTMFPAFSWPEFADMPTQNTLEQLNTTMNRLAQLPEIKASVGTSAAIKLYQDQYNLMVNRLHDMPQKKPAAEHKKPVSNNYGKIKQLQGLLGAKQTGEWNNETNTVFLNWLKTNGWNKYIVNNRFTGDLDAAINAINIEKATPKEEPKLKQFSRLDEIKKIGK